MHMKRGFFLLLVLSLVLPGWAATGRVQGRILNKSTGRGEPGVEVRLVRPGDKGPDRQIAIAKTGAQGQFAFGPFPVTAQDIFMAQTRWQGFRYETVAYDGTGHLKEMVGISV